MRLDSVFYEVAAILLVAAGFGAVGTRLRQPLIVSFLAAGIVVGPSGIGIVTGHDQIELLAQIGIALLLFVVGLRLDLHMIKTMGPVSLATGLGQVAFTSFFGFFIGLGLGLSVTHSLYVAVALTFSSTIIIVKLLSDKREIDALHGRIAVGFLIVQDIVVVLAMIGLTALGGNEGAPGTLLRDALLVLLKGGLFLAGIAALSRYLLPWLLGILARSNELLVVFAVAWAVFLATIGDTLGFSKEVGAFLGGVSLASTRYRDAIGSRLTSVRDFLLLFFFIDLGARLDLSLLGTQMGRAVVLSLFVLLGNPIIVMIIMGAMGYRKRTGFLAGLTVAQISEFSLILGALGLSMGHITVEVMGVITLVGLLTICLSTYMILYSGPLYSRLAPYLTVFERRTPHREAAVGAAQELGGADIILLGLGHYGGSIARNLIQRKKRLIGVDFDPQVLDVWRAKGLSVFYGDASDPEVFEDLPVGQARWVVSTIRSRDLNLGFLNALRSRGFGGKLALTARDQSEADAFRGAGAHVVLRPFADAAEQAVDSLTEAMHALPESSPWPMTLDEIGLKAGSVFAGKTIREIPLRETAGVSILAVSRAGKSHFDPEPGFRVYPGDRLVLLGEPENLARAVDYLERREFGEDAADDDEFAIGEIEVLPDSSWIGRTLAALNFRRDYRVTVIGIQRGSTRITAPTARETIKARDHLIVVGSKEAVEKLRLAPQL